MMYNRNSFYNGKQKYKIVKGTVTNYEVIAKGFTSQKAVREYYKKIRSEGVDTKQFITIGYKEE